jgi:hypothetical protein
MNKKFKKYIEDVCDECCEITFSGEYTQSLSFEEIDLDSGDALRGVGATINIDTAYLSFIMKIYPIIFIKYKAKMHEEIFDLILHEFCHILTEPLYIFGIEGVSNQTRRFLEDARERQTQRICDAFFLMADKLKIIDKYKIT